jgi:prepilin-type N-terminal cleavage/methylation domain-containing protein
MILPVPVSQEAHRNHGGFTLIELLVVILILGILMVVSLPVYNGAVQDANHRVCRANMQTIACAERSYFSRSTARVYTTDLTATGALSADLGSIPKCPQKGTYSITDGAGTALTATSTLFTVHCTSNGAGATGAAATCVSNGQTAGGCSSPTHDAPYVATEPNGFTLGVNTQ